MLDFSAALKQYLFSVRMPPINGLRVWEVSSVPGA
jgi:hypothetical protein